MNGILFTVEGSRDVSPVIHSTSVFHLASLIPTQLLLDISVQYLCRFTLPLWLVIEGYWGTVF
jgi:hypothetical protein